jgi:hypothetical protein
MSEVPEAFKLIIQEMGEASYQIFHQSALARRYKGEKHPPLDTDSPSFEVFIEMLASSDMAG